MVADSRAPYPPSFMGGIPAVYRHAAAEYGHHSGRHYCRRQYFCRSITGAVLQDQSAQISFQDLRIYTRPQLRLIDRCDHLIIEPLL